MEWRKSYLDLLLVPSSLIFSLAYHGWLWHKVRTQPRRTVIGINSAGGRLWVHSMMQDCDKRSVLAVQTLRNGVMGSTLMATTTILLCTGLGAIISSTYSVKKPISDSIYGSHGELMVALKYITLLLVFFFTFICYSLSICFLSQVSFLINAGPNAAAGEAFDCLITPEYVSDLLDKGFLLNTLGNRLFYSALPLLLWIFGPVLVFLSSAAMVPVMYCHDVVWVGKERSLGGGSGSGGGCGGGGKVECYLNV